MIIPSTWLRRVIGPVLVWVVLSPVYRGTKITRSAQLVPGTHHPAVRGLVRRVTTYFCVKMIQNPTGCCLLQNKASKGFGTASIYFSMCLIRFFRFFLCYITFNLLYPQIFSKSPPCLQRSTQICSTLILLPKCPHNHLHDSTFKLLWEGRYI